MKKFTSQRSLQPTVAEAAALVFFFRKYSLGANTKIWKKLLAGFGAALVGAVARKYCNGRVE